MSAAALLACPRCGGHPNRLDDGCSGCDDTGRVEPRELYAIEPAPSLPVYAAERAEHAMRAALRRIPHVAAEHLARLFAATLPSEPADALGLVQERAGLGADGARRIVRAYVDALDEHARVRELSRSFDRGPDIEGGRLVAHAQRIETACFPAHEHRL